MRKTLFLMSALLSAAMVSCVDKEPSPDGGKVPDANEYFDFSTSEEVSLTIDYGYEGYSPSFEIYLENPYDANGTFDSTAKPYFVAFTDENSSYESTISLPAYVKTVYLCSKEIGVPRCLELDVVNNAITSVYEEEDAPLPLDMQVTVQSGPMARTMAVSSTTSYDIKGNTTTIDRKHKLYSLYNEFKAQSSNNGQRVTYWANNSKVPGLYRAVSNSTTFPTGGTIGELAKRIKAALPNETDNSQYCRDSDITNVKIVGGEDFESAHIDLVFLSADCGYRNAMGYYYYKTDANLSANDIKKLPKYVVFPVSTTDNPNMPIKARLQFYGENYDQDGVDDFPEGYTIGWILFANLDIDVSKRTDAEDVNDEIEDVYEDGESVIYSNKECNWYWTDRGGYTAHDGCVSMTDEQTGKVIIGFEDQAHIQRL